MYILCISAVIINSTGCLQTKWKKRSTSDAVYHTYQQLRFVRWSERNQNRTQQQNFKHLLIVDNVLIKQ